MDFRFKAMRQMHDPEDLERPVSLASPRAWIVAFICAIVLAGVIAWSFVGDLPRVIHGDAVLTRPDGVTRVVGNLTGMVLSSAKQGETVTPGQPVVHIRDATGVKPVLSPVAGTVTEVNVSEGSRVDVGQDLLAIEPVGRGPLRAAVFVPASMATSIAPGMAVDVAVDAVPRTAFGVVHGHVASVSSQQVDQEQISQLVVNQSVQKKILNSGPLVLVLVDLERDPKTRSGFAWTTKNGPPFPLSFQDDGNADITVQHRKPIDFVFGSSS